MALPVFKIGRLPLCGGAGFDSQALPPFDSARATGTASLMAGLTARAAMESALSERTIAGESKGKTSAPVTARYFVYILSCSDGTLYVGSTSDLLRREQTHNEGRGAKYTAGRRPVRVVYSEVHESRSAAQKREAQLKRWSRQRKQALIRRDGDRLHGLAKRRT